MNKEFQDFYLTDEEDEESYIPPYDLYTTTYDFRREIKFRVWLRNRMDYGDLEAWVDWDNNKLDTNRAGVILMQFTGFKDKNGKEIYEGDIIANKNGVWLKIYWNDNLGQFRQIVCNRERVERLGYEWQAEPTDIDMRFNYKEIIGNIYENPELLSS